MIFPKERLKKTKQQPSYHLRSVFNSSTEVQSLPTLRVMGKRGGEKNKLNYSQSVPTKNFK